MALRTDLFDLGRLGLTSGEARRLDLAVAIAPFTYGEQAYAVEPGQVPARLDVSRTTNSGWALRLRFAATLEGPCFRCLGDASPEFAVDAREVHVPGEGEELESPYVSDEDVLDLEAWARDAFALALPAQITCRPDCAGLCDACGADLNQDPTHAHAREPDTRWAKLSEIRFER